MTIAYGGSNEFDALVYGAERHRGTTEYLKNQFTNMSSVVTEASSGFFNKAREMWDRFNGAEAINSAKAAVRKLGAVFQSNSIRELREIGEIQNAPIAMQRYIMAQPKVRERFHRQRCDGYSDTYVDVFPNDIGEQHYDYRRVMDGVLQYDKEGKAYIVHYIENNQEGEQNLTLTEQVDILNTWDLVASLMEYGERDPTSVYNSKL